VKKSTKIWVFAAVAVWAVIMVLNSSGLENLFPREEAMVTFERWESGKITVTFEDGKQKSFKTTDAAGSFANLEQRMPNTGEQVKLFYQGPFATGMNVWEELEIKAKTSAEVVCEEFYPDQDFLSVRFENGWIYSFCFEDADICPADLKAGDSLYIEYDGIMLTKAEVR